MLWSSAATAPHYMKSLKNVTPPAPAGGAGEPRKGRGVAASHRKYYSWDERQKYLYNFDIHSFDLCIIPRIWTDIAIGEAQLKKPTS